MGGLDMILEDYISFELAKLLKEKGFDESVNRFYEISTGQPLLVRSEYCRNSYTTDYAAPTLQMAMKWLREVHHIFIYIEPFITTSGLQGYKPYCTKIDEEFMWINPLNTSSDTYEEAVEAVLKYSLENLI